MGMANEQKTVSIGPLGVPKYGLSEIASIAVTGIRNGTTVLVDHGSGVKYIGRVMGGSLTILTGVVDVADAVKNGTGNDVITQIAGIGGALIYGTGAIYANGFEALATLDSNNDGIFNASDTHFSTLRVWQDANSDGKTDAGELTSLSDAGISSITLSNTQDGAFVGGNEVRSNSTYTRADGTSAAIASVSFIVNPNGLLYTNDGSIITAEDGSVSVYAVSDINGESVDVSTKGVNGVTSAIGNIGNDTLVGDALIGKSDNWLTGNLGEDILIGGAQLGDRTMVDVLHPAL